MDAEASGTLSGAGSGAALGSEIAPGYGTAIGALLGAGVGFFGGKEADDQKKKVLQRQAQAQAFSPWSKITPSTITQSGPVNNIYQGLTSGAKQGTDLYNAANKNAMPPKSGDSSGGDVSDTTGLQMPQMWDRSKMVKNPYSFLNGVDQQQPDPYFNMGSQSLPANINGNFGNA